jgi:glycosidase
LRRQATIALCWILLAGSLTRCASSSSSTPTSAPAPSGWWQDRVVYEVFVRSLADSGGDGTGDLAGLTAHLDDLNDGNALSTTALGIDAIWLMPISPSPSYHGYDVTDYEGVNPSYGTLSDLDAFVAAAHARGIKVLLDFVLNHSSSQHPWFLDSMSGTGSPKRSWYLWSPTDLGWQVPWSGASGWHYSGTTAQWYWGIFSPGMPDLNYGTPAVEAQLEASMRFWLARGVDGFRLDAVRYLVEDAPTRSVQDTAATHALLQRIRGALQADYPDVLLVGEAWAPLETVATYWGGGHELQLAFSFDLADAIRASAGGGDASYVLNVLARTETAYADRSFEAPFLSNHDQVRTMRQLAGDAAAARVAAATLLAMPGTPFVYYGEELGMQGGATSDDRDKRTPMRWNGTSPGFGFTTGTPWYTSATPEASGVDVATQRADPGSLWNLYRRLIAVRHARTGLRHGAAVRPVVEGGGTGVLALLRDDPSDRVLFVANYATTTATGPFLVDVAGATTVIESEGLAGAPSPSGGKTLVPGLAPRGFAYVGLQ